MTEPAYDLLIRGGRVATVSDVFEADVAISGETIAAIGRGLPGAKREIAESQGRLGGEGQVKAGVICAWISIALNVLIFVIGIVAVLVIAVASSNT